MRQESCIPAAVLTALAMLVPVVGWAQANAGVPAGSSRESVQDFMAHLNPQQKQQFDETAKAHQEQKYAEELAGLRVLLKDFPTDPILLKFASESALSAGETSFALNALKPIAQADPDDWQAAVLLTRACAESGDTACRDAGIAHMLDLHQRGITPPRLREYIVERVKAGTNTLEIKTSLVPWGYYKVYALGQVTDGGGKLFLSITLESNDMDQPLFAKDHPEEAAKGLREFSLDAYRETGLNSQGQRTQTHFTYKFFTGQPSYATIREEFLKIVNGQSNPISSHSGLIVQ